ncbi:MAG: hypothetical protein ACYS7Y_09665 [Planctomycetota bacterium]
MATKAQTEANRRNSKKSTGPKTAEGKEAVSQNAFKHGLFVKKDVVRDESQDEYDIHRDAMLAELAPVGPMEAFLVQRIVRLTWRLIRAERMQDHSIDYLGLQELCGYRAENFRSFYISANRIYDDDPQIPREHLWLGRLARASLAGPARGVRFHQLQGAGEDATVRAPTGEQPAQDQSRATKTPESAKDRGESSRKEHARR